MSQVVTASSPEVALAATGAALTVAQLGPVAAPGKGCTVIGWGIYFDGVLAADQPIIVELMRQTSAGTMTTGLGYNHDENDARPVTTVFQHTATAEPTNGGIFVARKNVHPQSGYEVILPEGKEIKVAPASYLGLIAYNPAGNAATNAIGYFLWEE